MISVMSLFFFFFFTNFLSLSHFTWKVKGVFIFQGNYNYFPCSCKILLSIHFRSRDGITSEKIRTQGFVQIILK